MAQIKRILAALACGLLLAACATRPPAELREDGVPFRELPAQRLEAGTCTMFLWARTGEEARRILMLRADPTFARVRLRQRLFDFGLREESGPKMAGFSPRMRFEGLGVSFQLDLAFAERDGLGQGFVVESGSLSYVSGNNWSAVLPVAGIVACQPLS